MTAAGPVRPEEYLTRLFGDYFEAAFRAAGLPWTDDNVGDMKAIVGNITDLVDEAVRAHAEDTPHLYPDGSAT